MKSNQQLFFPPLSANKFSYDKEGNIQVDKKDEKNNILNTISERAFDIELSPIKLASLEKQIEKFTSAGYLLKMSEVDEENLTSSPVSRVKLKK